MRSSLWRAYLPSLLLFVWGAGCGDDDGTTTTRDASVDAARDSGRDSGRGDSGSVDSGSVDSGSTDSGSSADSGPADSGAVLVDSGPADSGPVDSGPVDSGTDSGPSCTPTNPSTEACDGIDNDCNPATVDGSGEATFGQACDGTDSDSCTDDTRICNGTAIVCSAGTDSIEATATAGSCTDDTDNDCDGLKDALDTGCSAPFAVTNLDPVVTTGSARAAHTFVSVRVDASNNLHGGYVNLADDDFYYIKRTGTTWGTAESVDNRGIAGRDHSIFINKVTGRLNAIWRIQRIGSGSNIHDLYYSDKNPSWGTFVGVDLDPTGVQDLGVMSAQAPNNNIYVVYYDGRTPVLVDGGISVPGQDIYFSKSTDNGATWTRGVIDMTSDNSRLPRLVIDSAGVLHVIYESVTLGQLKHASSADQGTTWTIEAFGPAVVGNGQSLSAAIDSSDNIHVVYYNGEASTLDFMYTKRTGTTWSTPVAIDTTGDVGSANAITVNAAGNVFVCYYDKTNTDLKFARSANGSTWLAPETVEAGAGTIGNGCGVAVDSLGYIHVLYAKGVNNNATETQELHYATTQP